MDLPLRRRKSLHYSKSHSSILIWSRSSRARFSQGLRMIQCCALFASALRDPTTVHNVPYGRSMHRSFYYRSSVLEQNGLCVERPMPPPVLICVSATCHCAWLRCSRWFGRFGERLYVLCGPCSNFPISWLHALWNFTSDTNLFLMMVRCLVLPVAPRLVRKTP